MNIREKNIFCLISMVLLIVNNLIVFANQPSKAFNIINYYSNLYLLLWPLYLIYMVLIFLGTYSSLRTICILIVKGETKIEFIISALLVICSIFLVGYGTFYKETDSLKKRRQEILKNREEHKDGLLIKFGWSYEISRGGCIWRGDTIIDKYYSIPYYYTDTLVVDEESNTCHWTYKPMINYRINFFNKDKFTQDVANISYSPEGYFTKIQYVANCVNNKKVGEFYYDKDATRMVFQNDSIICFLFDKSYHGEDSVGYLLFGIEYGVAVLRDSMSNIYDLHADKTPNNEKHVIEHYVNKSNGVPIVKVKCEQHKKGKSFLDGEFFYYYDYFDIDTKDFVLCHAPYILSRKDTVNRLYVRDDMNLYDGFSHIINDSWPEVNGYPVIEYRSVRSINDYDYNMLQPKDTLEYGRYVMRDGKYVKEVQWKKE